MNIDKANEIIDFYIDNFDKTVGKEHDELFKWRCAWQCRKFWNIGSTAATLFRAASGGRITAL